MQESSQKRNRLQFAKSPYLLQHQSNPVDWHEWSDEAFEKAYSEDKPVFLSIGYSTCHWCHVMEHESFEDHEVARLMNDAFVNIKVDREERPDIDNVYMTVCQMVSPSCGWPLTVIMTPDKKPFFVSTYIPRESKYGRAGMLELVPALSDYWNNKREELLQSADKIVGMLAENSGSNPGESLDNSSVEAAYQQLRSSFDSVNGGFGGKPKFPSPHNLLFLLRYWHRAKDTEALEMVETTLRGMRRGGMFDHIGFGFHRYSTDERWFLPHFEKMLYDQALLSMAYTETFQATGRELYAQTAHEILTYVLRDMTDEKGGFYSAEDADSEGEEGKFYVWSYDEVYEILTEEEAKLCIRAFSITKEGTYHDEATGRPLGTNIPYQLADTEKIAESLSLTPEDYREAIESIRQKLFSVREKRIHPGKDDKVLVDWNGLMIAALAKAARVLGDDTYRLAAEKAANFILETMMDEEGRLMHRYRAGEAGIEAFADDYAFFIWGLLELHESTFDFRYLKSALNLNAIFLEHYWDEKEGGFFFSLEGNKDVLVRKKEVYDGAIPSANAVAMNNLIRIGRITADPEYEAKAMMIGSAFAGSVSRHQSAFTHLLSAVQFFLGPSFEVVIAGDITSLEAQAMLSALHNEYLPHKVVLFRSDAPDDIVHIAPYTKEHESLNGKTAAYVCRNYSCSMPVTEVEEMLNLLRK